jgi:multiple sugar transport system substrate-binding protein
MSLPHVAGLVHDRRTVLKGALAAAGLAAVPGLAACGSSSSKSTSKTVSFGSNAAVPQPKGAYETLFAQAQKDLGLDVKVNWVDHNTFQQNITTYLQGNPQDTFNWFSGERMRFFAAQGLISPVDDVWASIGGNFTQAMKDVSTYKGHYYFVPFDYYPWAVFYKNSFFAKHGYQPPTTWDDFINLAKKMKSDGLSHPIAFTDKDGWPAMGTFDYLNMRINGYAYHEALMAGTANWTDPQVKAVFTQWQELIPYYSAGALGLTWQEGAQQLQNDQAGMMVIGLDQIGTIFTGSQAADLNFFAFPEINPAYGQDAVEAPIDGFMVAKRPKNKANTTKLLEWLGTAKSQQLWLGSNPADIATATGVDTTKYTTAQAKAATFISKAKYLSQFMDRDTRPDFADPVILPALQKFLDMGTNPSGIPSLLNSIQAQKKQIFSTSG